MRARCCHLLVAGLAGLAAAACGGNFDDESELHDLRILAIKTEPAEIKLPIRYLFAAPAERPPEWQLAEWTVDVEVFAFDPRQGALTTSMFMCPDHPDDPACLEFDAAQFIGASVTPQQRTELEAVYLPRTHANTLADPALNPAVPLVDNRFEFGFTTAVIDSLLWREGFDPIDLFLAPLLPRLVADVRNSAVERYAHERAIKRFPLALDFQDPEMPREVLAAVTGFFNATPCTSPPVDEETFTEGPARCFYDRGANRNPLLTGFDLVDPDAEAQARARGERIPAVRFSDQPQLGPNPVLPVEPGATLHLRPVFAPGSMERYQVYVASPVSGTLGLEDRLEDFVCFWYITGGGLGEDGDQSNLTTSTAREGDAILAGPDAGDIRTPLDLTWVVRAAENLPPTGRDTLVLVVQDQRGGVAVGQLVVEYQR